MKKIFARLLHHSTSCSDKITGKLHQHHSKQANEYYIPKDTHTIQENNIALKNALLNWQGTSFTSSHLKAVNFLINYRNMNITQALKEIENLNYAQADGIAQGLSRRDVEGLNHNQISAFIKLNRYGLTSDNLRSWGAEGRFFGSFHEDALIYLIRDRHLLPQYAIREINGLNLSQAEGIAKGLSRNEVLGLRDEQINLYAQFRK